MAIFAHYLPTKLCQSISIIHTQKKTRIHNEHHQITDTKPHWMVLRRKWNSNKKNMIFDEMSSIWVDWYIQRAHKNTQKHTHDLRSTFGLQQRFSTQTSIAIQKWRGNFFLYTLIHNPHKYHHIKSEIATLISLIKWF